MTEYLEKLLTGAKPVWAFFIAAVNYVLFPDLAFKTAIIAVGIAIILDILTKYKALAKQSGGFRLAFEKHVINSNSLWEGTKIKLFSYLTVFILAGLSYRVTMFEQVSVFLATVVYTVIFLRESQSIVENLCDAGADLKWLAVWTKKKQNQILEKEDDSDETL